MRGIFLAACLALAIMPAAVGVRADEAAKTDRAKTAEPAFRLLELEGRKVRWTVPASGLPATITYAFLSEPAQFPGARNCDSMLPPEAALRRSGVTTEAFRSEVRAAFSLWEQAANIVFKETSSTAEAGILIGADAKPRGRAFTNVALREDGVSGQQRGPEHGMGAIRQSLICLNPDRPWKIGFDGDLDVYDLRFTVTHEIGHAIGLDHPSPEGQLMSFRYVEKTRGLQPGDIAGATALYGRKGMNAAADPGQTDDASSSLRAAAGTTAPAGDRAFGLGERTLSDGDR